MKEVLGLILAHGEMNFVRNVFRLDMNSSRSKDRSSMLTGWNLHSEIIQSSHLFLNSERYIFQIIFVNIAEDPGLSN